MRSDNDNFANYSIQGHPSRFAIDSEDVIDAIAESVGRIDIVAHHEDRDKKWKEAVWQHTLERMRCHKRRDGRLQTNEVPRKLIRRGDKDEINVVFLDDYIEYDLGHNIGLDDEGGMNVYKFWNGDEPVYAATCIDYLRRDGEVLDWHVELFKTRKAANSRVSSIQNKINERLTA